jgi:Amt family ammonium transporter
VTFAFALIGSWVLLKVVDSLIGLRVDEEQETEGLDLVLHDERGYDL